MTSSFGTEVKKVENNDYEIVIDERGFAALKRKEIKQEPQEIKAEEIKPVEKKKLFKKEK